MYLCIAPIIGPILLSLLLPFLTTLFLIGLPLVTRQTKPTLNTTATLSSSLGRSKRSHPVSGHQNSGGNGDDNNGDDHNNPDPKRSRLYHPHTAQCSPCVLWRQSGGDPNLKNSHPQSNSRHVGTEAFPLAQYSHFDNIIFHLSSDDCVCQPCHKDFRRKLNQENNIPRWAKVKQNYYSARENKHCIYCCGEECECGSVVQWGPDMWNSNNTSIPTWKKFLSLTGKVDHTTDHANHLCRNHYRRLLEVKAAQSCSICHSLDSSTWNLVCDVATSPDHICEAFQLELGSVHFFGWICAQCSLCYANDIQLEDSLSRGAQSGDPMTAQKSQLLIGVLDTLKNDGVVYTKDVMSQYKAILNSLHHIPKHQHNKLCNTFSKYLGNLSKNHHYSIFVPTFGIDAHGRVLYDQKKFSIHALNYMFKSREEEWKKQKSSWSIYRPANFPFPCKSNI